MYKAIYDTLKMQNIIMHSVNYQILHGFFPQNFLSISLYTLTLSLQN